MIPGSRSLFAPRARHTVQTHRQRETGCSGLCGTPTRRRLTHTTTSALTEGSLMASKKKQHAEEGEGGESPGAGGQDSNLASMACTICGDNNDEGGVVSSDRSASTTTTTLTTTSAEEKESLFALRCNSCSFWYHPWCLGYQLDLDRSCLITASEVDIPIDSTTGVPLVCQWFCDSCASTVTGVVAATAARRHSRPAAAGLSKSNTR